MRKLAKLLPKRNFRRGLREGVAAAVEHQTILAPLTIKTLIDIGANVGQFSLLVRNLHPDVHIVAFEPLPAPAYRYRKLFHSDPKVRLHQCAIGPHTEVREMHVAGRQDSSSLLPISEEQEKFAPGTAEVGLASVQVKRLDAVLTASDILPPAMLKLDVQGYELDALHGCRELLHLIDYVYVEVSFVELYIGQARADSVVTFLFERGFSLAGVNDPTFDRSGRCIQVDFLFDRK